MNSFNLIGKGQEFSDASLGSIRQYRFMCNVLDLPIGVPLWNPRHQNLKHKVYMQVASTLIYAGEPRNRFYYMNKGITIIAASVTKGQEDSWKIEFDENPGGIVDGGHTYVIICQNQPFIREHNLHHGEEPIEQFVKVDILTGVSPKLAVFIAKGLNTGVQVSDAALANYSGKFDPITNVLQGASYLRHISFTQNQPGLYDISYILTLLYMFRADLFPLDSRNHPVKAYSSRVSILNEYLRDPEAFMVLSPILKQILVFHDLVQLEFRQLYNEGGGRAGGLGFVEQVTRHLPFIGKTSSYRLTKAALFPILGAFRCLVEPSAGNLQWVTSYDHLLEVWRKTAYHLIQQTLVTYEDVGRKANAIGRSKNHWQLVFDIVQRAH